MVAGGSLSQGSNRTLDNSLFNFYFFILPLENKKAILALHKKERLLSLKEAFRITKLQPGEKNLE